MKKSGNRASNRPIRNPGQVVGVLADWWTRPDAARVALWNTTEYREQVTWLWRENQRNSAKKIETLMSALALEQSELAAEYERLFVGPAAIPCPPYEAVWRTDRPKHEQGTVIGKSTVQVKQLYGDLGLRLRPDQVELADHIAVELEALAYAWHIDSQAQASRLIGGLRDWLPAFCESVVTHSDIEFYRQLAAVTADFFSSKSDERAGMPSAESCSVV